MYYAVVISLFALAVLTFRKLHTWRVRNQLALLHGCKPPPRYPHRDPFLGLDFLVGEFKAQRANRYLDEQIKQYAEIGNTFSVRHLLSTVIYTIEPQNLKTMMTTNFNDFGIDGRRMTSFAPLLGESIFLKDGPEWETQGSLISPYFYKTQHLFFKKLQTHVDDLTRLLSLSSGVVDLGPLFQQLCADTSSDFLLGHSVNLLNSPKSRGHRVIHAIHDALSVGELRWVLGSLAWFWTQSEMMRNVRVVQQFFHKHVQRVLSCKEERNSSEAANGTPTHSASHSFLEQYSHKVHDSKLLHDEMLGLFIAGTDSTAALLSNMFFELSRQPELWTRLREEVGVLQGRCPRLEELRNFRLVANCIVESLRLHSVACSNTRVARNDTVLPVGGGQDGAAPILVPAGTMVHFSPFALHRRQDLWGLDADQFRPDRWLDLKQSWNFIPFLRGPRNCPGRDFATIEATYTLIRLLQTCEKMTSADDRPWTETISLFCSPKNGAKVRVDLDQADGVPS